jgi:hypothetical protein
MNKRNPYTVKTAKARATLAANMIKKGRPYYGEDDREFDACLEMGDGKEVVKHLTEKVITDSKLAYEIINGKILTNESLVNACKICLGYE